jgi:hypothetical protein
MYGVFFLGTLYLEHVLHYGALRTGLSFLPMTLVVATMSMGVTARLVTAYGPRRVALPGILCVVVAVGLLSQVSVHGSFFPLMFFAFALMGLGMGTASVPLLTLAMAHVPAKDAGLASGVVNVSMQVAGALGVAVLSTISTDRTRTLAHLGHTLPSALTGGYQVAFIVAAGTAAAAFLLALTVVRSPRRAQEGGARGERAKNHRSRDEAHGVGHEGEGEHRRAGERAGAAEIVAAHGEVDREERERVDVLLPRVADHERPGKEAREEREEEPRPRANARAPGDQRAGEGHERPEEQRRAGERGEPCGGVPQHSGGVRTGLCGEREQQQRAYERADQRWARASAQLRALETERIAPDNEQGRCEQDRAVQPKGCERELRCLDDEASLVGSGVAARTTERA